MEDDELCVYVYIYTAIYELCDLWHRKKRKKKHNFMGWS